MIVIGVDENGLGPLLGPLMVTATAFEVDTYDREAMWTLCGDDLPAGDSKETFKRGNPAAAERAILRWLALFGQEPATHRDLVAAVSSPLPGGRPCPSLEAPAACVPGETELPLWCSPSQIDISLGIWNRFDEAGVRPRAVRLFEACPGWLNRGTEERGVNKLELDFTLMLSLVKEIAAKTGDEVLALCGKVGSTKAYGKWLAAVGKSEHEVVEEKRENSEYRIPRLGRIRFIRDGDGTHMPIAVASMIGKYVRELAMIRINEAFGRTEKIVSGYRDPVTAKFVEEALPSLRENGLERRCFTRCS